MQSSLKFGTSGLRGLADELNGPPAYAYTRAFIDLARENGYVRDGSSIYVGRDLRASSPAITALCLAAIEDAGLEPVDCGALPTPALSCHAMARGAPALMITGSHIPEDRNGLKFYRPDGEIDKADEAGITRHHEISHRALVARRSQPDASDDAALRSYRDRYLAFLAPGSLAGLRVGVYQHSSVARDLIVDLLSTLGADAVPLGRAASFVPVDTEALRPEDVALLREWAADDAFDAIVSTDGDADRPLIADEKGEFVRGDLVGAITAHWLGADCIVAPVTANSALEGCGRFARVVRTRVGSPYVIEGMNAARSTGASTVVGFEANGGVLLGSAVSRNERGIAALPTRDALLPILACLASVAETGLPLSRIGADFGFRVARSDRLQKVPGQTSGAFLAALSDPTSAVSAAFADIEGIARRDTTDGLRLFLGNDAIVHYRASGNAPELRCYVEAPTEERASELLERGLAFARVQTESELTR